MTVLQGTVLQGTVLRGTVLVKRTVLVPMGLQQAVRLKPARCEARRA